MGIGTPERKLQRREQITSILRAAPLRRMRLSDLGNRSKRNKGELRLRKLLISTPHIFRVFIRGEVELIVSPLLLLHEEGVIEKEGALSPVEILAVAVARPQDLRREATPCV